LLIFIWILAMGWLWQLYQWIRYFPSLPDLTRMSAGSLPALRAVSDGKPDLTVITPACNEEAAIGATLHSLLASREIRLQIIAVDDRSTDCTGEIMDEIAASNAGSSHTLQVMHIKELPAGWLGKPHALSKAAKLALADWILFTDGDVSFATEAAALALRFAVMENADHLVVMPDWIMGSPGEAAMHGAMHALTTWNMRLWRLSDPESRDFLGVGAFNLVRRDAYEALGGFEALRMEVLEDLRLGWMLKRAGYRQRVTLGPGLVAVHWSNGAWGIVRNLEKNLFALHRYSIPLTLLGCFGLLIQIALPPIVLVTGGWARVATILLYASLSGIYIASRKVTRVPPAYVLLYPFASCLFLFAVLRSMTLALLRGGVLWRGTLYSLKELRAHAGRLW
jgi:glycosyltransferase involved in cell wall biosynthesis